MRYGQSILRFAGASALVMAIAISAPASIAATTATATSPAIGNICTKEASARAQIDQIPSGILRAISIVETGRWNAARKASFAWPWTVTAKGHGKYYPTKATAIHAVRTLQDRGVTNIDVGCMQINLHYHGEAFKTLNDAFDPKRNIAYAAKFLGRLQKRENSWNRAIKFYHSSIPKRQAHYYKKIRQSMHTLRRRDTAARRIAIVSPRQSQPKVRRPNAGPLNWKPIRLRRSRQTHPFIRKVQPGSKKAPKAPTPDWAIRRTHDPVRAALRLRPFKP
jgi:hypothetical protein